MDSNGLEEDFIKSVGRLTLNFAHLEFCFMLLVGSQSGSPQPLNQIITSELSFKQLLNVSAGIYREIEPDLKKIGIFEEILKESSEMEQKRNTVTHSFYGHNRKTKTIIRRKNTVRRAQGLVEHEEKIDAETVNKIADQINNLSIKLKQLIFQLSH